MLHYIHAVPEMFNNTTFVIRQTFRRNQSLGLPFFRDCISRPSLPFNLFTTLLTLSPPLSRWNHLHHTEFRRVQLIQDYEGRAVGDGREALHVARTDLLISPRTKINMSKTLGDAVTSCKASRTACKRPATWLGLGRCISHFVAWRKKLWGNTYIYYLHA